MALKEIEVGQKYILDERNCQDCELPLKFKNFEVVYKTDKYIHILGELSNGYVKSKRISVDKFKSIFFNYIVSS